MDFDLRGLAGFRVVGNHEGLISLTCMTISSFESQLNVLAFAFGPSEAAGASEGAGERACVLDFFVLRSVSFVGQRSLSHEFVVGRVWAVLRRSPSDATGGQLAKASGGRGHRV